MGCTQNSRSLAPLRAGWLAVDGRTPRRLLAETLPAAALFNFFDAPDRKNGQWDAFYARVPLVRYARLAEIDLTAKTERFRALFTRLMGPDQHFRFEPEDPLQLAAVRGIAGELLRSYRSMDEEAEIFADFPHETSYAAMLLRAIREVLAADYRMIYPWKKWLEEREQAQLPPLRFQWWGEPNPSAGRRDPTVLFRAVWSGQSVLGQLVEQARSRYEYHFATPWGLPPHFALYLAFLRQFGGAQAALNELPVRHRDYYYRQVLLLQPKPAVPDTAYVAFTAAPQSSVSLPAGTRLSAGKDAAGVPLLYATTVETTVTNSTLAQVATLWTGPVESGGFYAAPRADSADGRGAPLPAGGSWAPFGADQGNLPAGVPRSMPDATLGFAVSSPTLHLEEGVRRVTLTFNLVAPSAPAGVKPTPAASPAGPPALVPGEVTYTGPHGWVTVEPASVSFTAVPAAGAGVAFEIDFTLPETAAPWLNFQAKLHGPGYDERTPVLRVQFAHPKRALSPGLTTLQLQSAVLRVKVTGLRNLTLLGAGGRLAPGKPLPLFGSPPQLGAPLLIGSAEVFRKKLQALSLTAHWQGLPADPAKYPAGLSDYFAPYVATVTNPDPAMFCNDQYRISLAALANSGSTALGAQPETLFTWIPAASDRRLGNAAPPAATQPGAATTAPAGPIVHPAPCGTLQSTTTWTVDAGSLSSLVPVPELAGPLAFSPSSRTGFLSLALLAPDYLFGQPLYSAVLAQITSENSLAMIAAARTPPAPAAKPPPVPARSAYALLRTPAPPGLFSWVAKTFWPGAKPEYTFNAALFSALALRDLPPPVTQAVEQAGQIKAAELGASLLKLKGRRFSDQSGFREAIAQAAGLDPASDVVGPLIQALAALVVPPPPSDDTPASASAPAGANILPLPPPPLVPTAGSLTLDYEAAVTLTLSAAPAPAVSGGRPWDQLWQISPFALSRVSRSQPLLPAYAPGGELYLGFRGVEPPETLSLLFVLENLTEKQLAALSVEPLPPLEWACLTGDTWREVAKDGAASAPGHAVFDQQYVHDGTSGLQRSGIIRIELPPTANTSHTIMPDGLVWLRVRTAAPAARLRVVQILPHAAPVAWVPPLGVAPADLTAHFAQPLPAGALNTLVLPNPAIAQIAQPLPSTGGAPPEQNEPFAMRVSERLRHKGRALAAPDYERLLLQQHPEVFSARVLRPDSVDEAGEVRIVVLPVVRTVPADVPPVFLPGDLRAMADGLEEVAPLSAQVRVLNPTYTWLTVHAAVQFRRDRSFQAYAAELSQDINAFVSPWLYDQSIVKEPVRSFRLSALTDHIRRQLAYVELLDRCLVTVDAGPAGTVTYPRDDAEIDPLIAPRGTASLLIGVTAHALTAVAPASL